MFEHVTTPVSFVFAIAIAHLLTRVTELIWARGRVRVSNTGGEAALGAMDGRSDNALCKGISASNSG